VFNEFRDELRVLGSTSKNFARGRCHVFAGDSVRILHAEYKFIERIKRHYFVHNAVTLPSNCRFQICAGRLALHSSLQRIITATTPVPFVTEGNCQNAQAPLGKRQIFTPLSRRATGLIVAFAIPCKRLTVAILKHLEKTSELSFY
jgi:hypothetical protein